MNLGRQILRQGTHGRLAVPMSGGLGHIVRCAAGQRLKGHLGAALGERTAHDDRHFVPPPAQLPQRGQPIHHRHLHIQQNQAGTQVFNAIQSRRAVARGSSHFQPGVGRDHRAQQAAHHRRVVHDQNAGP
jgi:hypothetical protein